MKKYILKVCLVVMTLIFSIVSFFCVSNTVKASQYYTFGYRNSNGITYQKFWPFGNTTEWQQKAINDMIYNWNTSNNQNVVTPMNLSYTKDKSQSIMDFSYIKQWYDSAVGRTGETTYWNWSNKVNYANGVPYSNWSSALIQFGGPEWANGTNPFNTSRKNTIKYQTFAHEIGHGVGLAHNPDYSYMSIMRTPLDDIPDSVKGPWSNDLYGVNSLYK